MLYSKLTVAAESDENDIPAPEDVIDLQEEKEPL